MAKIIQDVRIIGKFDKGAGASRFFAHFLAIVAQLRRPNFVRPLHGVGEHNTKSFFVFF